MMKKTRILLILTILIFLLGCQDLNEEITIEFDSQGGTSIDSMSLNLNDFELSLPTTEKEGYEFLGWYLEDDMSIEDIDLETLTDRVILYAKWGIITYPILYVLDDGINPIINPSKYTIETDIILGEPEKEGYKFKGFYDNPDFEGETITEIKQNNGTYHTLYAKWEIINYPINYVLNGGNNHPNNPTSYTYELLINLEEPTRKGHKFNGFYDNPTFNGHPMIEITGITQAAINLYARWELLSYKIVFNSNGGTTINDLIIPYDTILNLPSPTKELQVFSGWYLDEMLIEPFMLEKMPDYDLTLYAKWQTQITFNANGGSMVTPIVANPGDLISVPEAPIKTGMTFTGWFIDQTFSQLFNFDIMPNENLALYARWQNSIIFESFGGNKIESITGDAGTKVTAPENPTRIGHQFLGWYSDSSFITSYVFNVIPESNITIYAKWKVNQYSIVFNENGGTNVNDYQMVDYGTNITYPIPIKSGYQFTGWFLDNQTFQTPYSNPYMEDKNITLYAKWDLINYSISYNLNGGTNDPLNINQFTIVTQLSLRAPVKIGYQFLGWYENSDFSGSQVSQIVGQYTNHLVLYAKFQINQYTISFNSMGGTSISSIVENYLTAISKPDNPTRLGYTFEGWYNDAIYSELYQFQMMPAENLTLYAKWKVNNYTMSFESNGGSLISSITQAFGTTISEPTTPIKTDYVFRGWYLDENFETKYTITTMPASNIKLYAKWTLGQDDLGINTFLFEQTMLPNGNIKLTLFVDGEVSFVGYDLSLIYDETIISIISTQAIIEQTINSQNPGIIRVIHVDALSQIIQKTALLEIEIQLDSSTTTQIEITVNEIIDIESNYQLFVTEYHTIAFVINE